MKQQKLDLKTEEKEIIGPYELPKGWRWARIGEVIKEERKAINPQEYPGVEFWHLSMECVEGNTGKLLHKICLRGAEIKSTKYKFNSNHILYGKLRPYLNKVYNVQNEEEGICTTEFIPFVVNGADKEYVAQYLRTKQIVDFAMNNLTGTRQPRTDVAKLLDFYIPIPPLEEQKRIVARIEELFGKINDAKRQRIEASAQAEALISSALYEVFSKADEKGWRWVRLGDIFETQQGVSMSPKRRIGISPYPFLRTLNVRWGYVDTSNLDHMDFSKEEVSRLALRPGDLLVCEGGEVGRTAIWKGEVETCLYQNHIHRLRQREDEVVPEFYMFWMEAAFKVFGLYKGQESKTAIPNLSSGRLNQFKIPLPSFEEQKRFVVYLQNIREKTINIQKIQEETEKEVEKLREAILHKAFKGELIN